MFLVTWVTLPTRDALKGYQVNVRGRPALRSWPAMETDYGLSQDDIHMLQPQSPRISESPVFVTAASPCSATSEVLSTSDIGEVELDQVERWEEKRCRKLLKRKRSSSEAALPSSQSPHIPEISTPPPLHYSTPPTSRTDADLPSPSQLLRNRTSIRKRVSLSMDSQTPGSIPAPNFAIATPPEGGEPTSATSIQAAASPDITQVDGTSSHAPYFSAPRRALRPRNDLALHPYTMEKLLTVARLQKSGLTAKVLGIHMHRDTSSRQQHETVQRSQRTEASDDSSYEDTQASQLQAVDNGHASRDRQCGNSGKENNPSWPDSSPSLRKAPKQSRVYGSNSRQKILDVTIPLRTHHSISEVNMELDPTRHLPSESMPHVGSSSASPTGTQAPPTQYRRRILSSSDTDSDGPPRKATANPPIATVHSIDHSVGQASSREASLSPTAPRKFPNLTMSHRERVLRRKEKALRRALPMSFKKVYNLSDDFRTARKAAEKPAHLQSDSASSSDSDNALVQQPATTAAAAVNDNLPDLPPPLASSDSEDECHRHRGIARIVGRIGSHAHMETSADIFTDDSESEPAEEGLTLGTDNEEDVRPIPRVTSISRTESDQIDRMIHRTSAASYRRKNRQTKLSLRPLAVSSTSNYRPPRRANILDAYRNTKRTSATKSTPHQNKSPPKFLKVASRRIRRNKHASATGDDPFRKRIRFHDLEDDNDSVYDMIHRWRSGDAIFSDDSDTQVQQTRDQQDQRKKTKKSHSLYVIKRPSSYAVQTRLDRDVHVGRSRNEGFLKEQEATDGTYARRITSKSKRPTLRHGIGLLYKRRKEAEPDVESVLDVMDTQSMDADLPELPPPLIESSSTRTRVKATPKQRDVQDYDWSLRGRVQQANTVASSLWTAVSLPSQTFDIEPLRSGVHFDDSTYLGQGRLCRLVADTAYETQSRLSFALKVSLNLDISVERFCDQFVIGCARIIDAARDVQELESCSDPITESAMQARRRVNECIDFLNFTSEFIASARQHGAGEISLLYSTIAEQGDMLAANMAKLVSIKDPKAMSGSFLVELNARFRWYLVDWAYRCTPLSNSKHEIERCAIRLMEYLLPLGMTTTSSMLREHNRNSKPLGQNAFVAELWIALVHVLEEPSLGFFSVLNGVLISSWDQLLSRQAKYRQMEKCWYTIFAMCPLFQFLDAGLVSSIRRPAQNWTLVQSLLGHLEELIESNDSNLSGAASRNRDQYLRAVFARCFNLLKIWEWEYDLPTILDLYRFFDSRKLANLDSEFHVGIPTFLQSYNGVVSKAIDDEDTTFHILLKILALIISNLIGDNGTIRLSVHRKELTVFLSKISPTRVLTYPGSLDYTSQERSMLTNHCSLVLLFMHLIPESARTRISQLRSVLKFANSDLGSRLRCIQAMMCAARLCLHHEKELDAVADWFTEMCVTLVEEMALLEKERSKTIVPDMMNIGESNTANGWITEQTKRRITAAIEHDHRVMEALLNQVADMIEKPSMPQWATFYSAAWTTPVLSYSFKYARIGIAAARLLSTGLSRWFERYHANRLPKDDSQDLFSDSFDYDDPNLNTFVFGSTAALSQTQTQTQVEPPSKEGMLFAKFIAEVVSPSLYQYLSNIFGSSGSADGFSSRQWVLVDKVIGVWTMCAKCLVWSDLRKWTVYLHPYGHESFSRFQNPRGKKHVGLAFLTEVLKDKSVYQELSESDVLQTWFTTIVDSRLTLQHVLTSQVLSLGQSDLWKYHPFDDAKAISQQEFEAKRLTFIDGVIEQMGKSFDQNNATWLLYLGGTINSCHDCYVSFSPAEADARRGYARFIQHILDTIGKECGDVSLAEKRFFEDNDCFKADVSM